MKNVVLSAANVRLTRQMIDQLPLGGVEESRKLHRASDLLKKPNSVLDNGWDEYSKQYAKAKRPIEVEAAKAVVDGDKESNALIQAKLFLLNDSFKDQVDHLEEVEKTMITLELEDADYDFIQSKVTGDIHKGLNPNAVARTAYLEIVDAFKDAKEASKKKATPEVAESAEAPAV